MNPDPITDPANTFGFVTALGRLVRDPATGSVGAVRGAVDPVINVTAGLSIGVQDLIAGGAHQFVTPVETGAQGGRGSPSLQWAAIPIRWDATASRVTIGQIENGRVITDVEVAPPDPRRGTAISVGAVPSNRYGAHGLLSALDNAVYLVGGRLGDETGPPTGEIWRYDLRDLSWLPVFTQTSAQDPLLGVEVLGQGDVLAVDTSRQLQPEEVLASAYDSQAGVLLVLDRAFAETPESRSRHAHPQNPAFVRLIRYDVRSQTSTLVARWPNTGAFERFGMTTGNDGTFVVVVTPKREHRWLALRFSIGEGTLKWEAIQRGEGDVLDEPIRTTFATYLPVRKRGVSSLVALELAPLRRHDRGPDRW